MKKVKCAFVFVILVAAVSTASGQSVSSIPDSVPFVADAMNYAADTGAVHVYASLLPNGQFPEDVLLSYDQGIQQPSSAMAFSSQTERFRQEQLWPATGICGLDWNDLRCGTRFYGYGLQELYNRDIALAPSSPNPAEGSLSATAAAQRTGAIIAYEITGPGAGHAASASWHSGPHRNGWAFAAAASGRLRPDAYVQGAFQRAGAYYGAVSKQLGKRGSLHWVAFGQAAAQGRALPATKEALELDGSVYYNPGWGYQEGKRRNANVLHAFQPSSMLAYDRRPDSSSHLYVSVGITAGTSGSSSLDWYNTDDPRPDYYKNLPGYYLTGPDSDTAKAAAITALWTANDSIHQLNWNKMYEANRANADSVAGITGKRALYMLGEDRVRMLQYSVGAGYSKAWNSRWETGITLSAQWRRDENDRHMLDLLGADYFVDLNQFAERTYAGNPDLKQQDLYHPDRIVRTGDRYAYYYTALFHKIQLQGWMHYNTGRWLAFITGNVGTEGFRRQGQFRNGVFANDSYGNSISPAFFTGSLQAGITYSAYPHRAYLRLLTASEAPLFDHTFIAPRTRNTTVDAPVTAITKALEAGYRFHTARFAADILATVASQQRGTSILRFYHDDYRTFVNYVMRSVDKQRLAATVNLQWNLSALLAVTAAVSWQQYFYASDPLVAVYRDNDTSGKVVTGRTYFKNSFVAAGPQTMLETALRYKDRHGMLLQAGVHYLDRNYISMNPLRRTEEAVQNTMPGSDAWRHIVDQERLPAAWFMDLQAGRAFTFTRGQTAFRRNSLYVGIHITNLLHNRNRIAGGWEQLRFDTREADPDRFPAKYRYAAGTVATVQAALHF